VLRQLTQRAGFTVLEARPVHPVPLELEPTDSLTCVARLPESLAQQMHDTVRRWPGADAHYVYPAATLHVTVLNLARIDGDDEAVSRVAGILAGTRPLSLRLQGFGVSSHSVYVRVLDPAGDLGALRRRLVAVTGRRPRWHLRRLAFVNVVRYRSAAAEVLLRAASSTQLRPVDLMVDRVELVRTDRLFSTAGTSFLRTVDLSRRP
jgi:hypothetical protein